MQDAVVVAAGPVVPTGDVGPAVVAGRHYGEHRPSSSAGHSWRSEVIRVPQYSQIGAGRSASESADSGNLDPLTGHRPDSAATLPAVFVGFLKCEWDRPEFLREFDSGSVHRLCSYR